MRPILLTTLLTLALVTASRAQGGSAVITLVMPPPGGEGFSMLQTGGAFADGAVSTYYNPALLADLERQTGSQIHFTRSHQDLLPVFDIEGLEHRYAGLALSLPDAEGGTDIGVGFFRNRADFGRNLQTDEQGEVIGAYDSWEAVYGAGIGVRLGLPVSLGATAKFIDSRLAQGVTSSGEERDGIARSWAFDLGFLANPRLTPAPGRWRGPWFEVMPSLGLALRNLGPDVYYVDPDEADPIPTTADISTGLQLRIANLAEGAVAMTREAEVHRRGSFDATAVWNRGYTAKFLFFRFSEGWLDDPRGKRDEKHSGVAVEADLLGLHTLYLRMALGDWSSPPSVLEKGLPFARTRILGQTFRANPRFSMGWRRIKSRDDGIRDGQDAVFFNLSL